MCVMEECVGGIHALHHSSSVILLGCFTGKATPTMTSSLKQTWKLIDSFAGQLDVECWTTSKLTHLANPMSAEERSIAHTNFLPMGFAYTYRKFQIYATLFH